MGYKTTSSRTLAAASAVASSYAPINTGNGTVTVTGSGVNANTTISTVTVTPGQSTTKTTISTPVIGNVQYLDSNNNVTVGISAVSTSGGNILINGSNFNQDSVVYVNNSTVTVTYISKNQLRAAVPAASAGNVAVMVFTPNLIGAMKLNGLRYSGVPTWTTAAVGFQNGTAANVALVASSDSTLTYTLQAGSTLPTGISLISTGYLTGTPTGYSTNTTTSAVIIATDSEGQATQQTVNVTVTVSDPQFPYTTLLLNGETSVTPFIADASTNNFGLTVNGDAKANKFSPYYGDGYYSNLFNGSSDKISVPASSTLAFGAGDFTIEAWFYISGAQTQTYGHAIAGTYDAGSNGGWGIVVNRSTDARAIAFVHANAWQLSYYPSAYLNTNQWYHVAVVRSGSTMTMYLNGTSVASATYTTTDAVSATCYIGSQGASSCYFPGYISNVRTVKGTAVYTGAFTPSTTPLTAVANTQLLTCQSSRFLDKSTNAATVTATGTTISPAIPFAASSSYATYGSAYFDGTGDFLSMTHNTSLSMDSGNFSAECWCYLTQYVSSGAPTLINKSGKGNVSVPHWLVGSANGYWLFQIGHSGTSGTLLINNQTSTVTPTNKWCHVALIKTGTTYSMYVDGVRVGTSTLATVPLDNNPLPLTIGFQTDQTALAYWYGYISDVRVIKGSLPSGYDASQTTIPVTTTPLAAEANTQLLTCQYSGGANNSGIIDNGPFNNAITRVGNATQGSFSPYSLTGWATLINSAASNSGSILPASNSNLNAISGDFTLEFWGMRTAISAFNTVMMNASTTSFCRMASAGTMNILSSSTTTSQADARVFAAIGRWFHMAISRQSGTVYVHIDGVQITSFAYASNVSFSGGSGSTACLIGNYNNNTGQEWVGYMSNLRVVTGSAVYALNSTFTPSVTPLTAVPGTQLLLFQNNRIIDNSSNGVSVTLAGTVTPSVQAISPFAPATAYSPTTHGGSCYFDGTGDYLTLPASTNYNLTGDFTFEAWVYPTVLQTNDFGIFDARVGGATAQPWIVTLSNVSGYKLRIFNGTNYTGSINIPLNTWTHVAWTRSGTALASFVNGVRDYYNASFGTGSLSPGSTAPRVGHKDNGLTGYETQGYISDLRLINGTALYSTSFTPPTAPLTASTNTGLLLNFTNGGIVDAHSSTVLETVGNAQVSTAVKKYGNASLSFGGSQSLLFPGASIPGGAGSAFTVEFWIYATSYNSITIMRANGNVSSLGLSTNASGQLIVSNTFTADFYTSTTALSPNVWTHVAIVRNSSNLYTIYFNGTSAGTAVTYATSIGTATQMYMAYNTYTGGYSTFYLDDFRVTKGFARYTANFTAPTSAFLGQ